MPYRAKAFIAAVVVVGAAVLLLSATAGHPADPKRLLSCIAIAVLVSVLKVRFPGMQSSMSANFVVLLASLPVMDLPSVLAIAVVSVLVQSLWRPRTKPRPVQIAFSMATVIISVSLAHALVRSSHVAEIPALLLASAVFFVFNTLLVCRVISLLHHKPFVDLWRRCHLWATPYYVAGAVLAGLIVLSEHLYGWRHSLMAYPVLYLIYSYYSAHMKEKDHTLVGA